jgi:ubiquinol-cytochrome c reductase cytochrome b subunit
MFHKIQYNRLSEHFLISIITDHIIAYPTPKNLNYIWSFGALSGIFLVIQIVTGLFLSMHYIPEISLAFDSVEHIMRDVQYGWFMRYTHANGASMFFFVVFFHIFRSLYYGSYVAPRLQLWISGIIIFFLLMAIAFMGYVLPWGQMSLWGATVITNLFSAIPIYGDFIVQWLWGGFSVDQATLNRFYSFHFFLPFILTAVVFGHLAILHNSGSSDPVSADSNSNFKHPAVVSFFPYFFTKDFFIFFVILLFFFFLIFYYPNALGHPDNYIKANPMVTPAHIVPEWYFLPFYAILRSIPNKLGGVVAMVFSILGLITLPLFTPKYRLIEFKFFYSFFIWLFGFNFLILGWIGQLPVEEPYTSLGLFTTFLYFFILYLIIPVLCVIEKCICERFFLINFFDFSKLQFCIINYFIKFKIELNKFFDFKKFKI